MPWVWVGSDKEKRIAELKRLIERDGDRRDSGDWLPRVEAELYKLTGDEQYAPYDED